MDLLGVDMILMHVVIPVLTIISFIYNDSPIGKFRFRWVFAGNAYALAYTLTIIFLVATGIIGPDDVPYFFLDINRTSIAVVLLVTGVIFCIGSGLCYVLVELNRKLYWRSLSIK